MNSLLEESENTQDSELKKQKLEKAAEIANQMIENQNDSDSAHYALSKNASQNKKYDDALAELEKAIRMNRENPLYYYDKGKILYLKRNYEEAQWNFEKACELDKNFYQSKYNLGLTYERFNQNEDAQNSFLQAIDIKNTLRRHWKSILIIQKFLKNSEVYIIKLVIMKNLKNILKWQLKNVLKVKNQL